MRKRKWFKARDIPIVKKWLKKRCTECKKAYPHYFCKEHQQALEKEVNESKLL